MWLSVASMRQKRQELGHVDVIEEWKENFRLNKRERKVRSAGDGI